MYTVKNSPGIATGKAQDAKNDTVDSIILGNRASWTIKQSMMSDLALSTDLSSHQDEAAKILAALQNAVALHQKGQFIQAQEIYRRVLKLRPQHFDALHLSGVAAAQLKNHEDAAILIGRALEINPASAVAHFNHGVALAELGRWRDAVDSYKKAIRYKGDYAEAYNGLGNALGKLGQPQAAKDSYDQSIRLNPGYAGAYFGRGNLLSELKQYDAAIDSYNSAIRVKADFAEAYSNRGVAFYNLQKQESALADFDAAVTLRADYAEAYFYRGLALRGLGHFEAALDSYDKAIRFKPEYAAAYNHHGILMGEMNRHSNAIESYDKAILFNADFVEAHINRGVSLRELGQLYAALESYDKALQIQPKHSGAHNNRGVALFDLRLFPAAIASYDKAIQFGPYNADAYNNRGVVLRAMKQSSAALADYDRALEIQPNHADAYCNRGNALGDLKQLASAIDSYEKALTLRPDYEFLRGTWLHAKMHLCDWTGIEGQIADLLQRIGRNEKVAPSFPVLALTGSARIHRKAAEILANSNCPANSELGSVPKRKRHSKIRVGYYSADFYNHATAYLMARLIELHNRDEFEIYGFSFGPDYNDYMRRRVAGAFDKFFDVRNRSDRDVAELSRSLAIDIAVDLKGFTQDERAGIFSRRAAPLQVSYLGYPGTMGVEYMDYIVADPIVIPEGDQVHYAEKIVYLPDSYQVNDTKRKISTRKFTRKELGLPTSGFVFCCFNNSYKITPATFEIWMRILKKVEGSVLWLFDDKDAVAFNLRKEARRYGVEPGRLVFAKPLSADEHLARHRMADLFLDTLPYNAHTTASDALWVGLPLITCVGEAFAGRVAASLLSAIDMPELITSTPAAYECLAIELATKPARLNQIKQKLEHNRPSSPLFNTPLFARNIENAFVQMYERYLADLPPDHIHVAG